MRIILVGPPAGGKTTFLKLLQKEGIKIFNADLFVHQIYKFNQPGYQIIKETFGDQFVNKKEVDRAKLRNLIINDSEASQILNEKIHPLVYDYLQDKNDYVAELPLVNRSSVKFKYDKIILVTADLEIIKARLQKRNFYNRDFLESILKKWDNATEYDSIINTSNNLKDFDLKNFLKKYKLKK